MTPAYRLLAVDVDGTLLDSQGRLPDANRMALHEAHQAGLTVCLCTGRSLTETRKPIAELGLDSDIGIFVFGAIISGLPQGNTLHRTPLPPELSERLVTHFRERGYPVLILYDVTEKGCDYELINGRRNCDAFDQWLAVSPSTCSRMDAWQPGAPAPVRIGVIETPGEIERTMNELGEAFNPTELKFNAIYAPNYGVHVVECFAPQVNKWYGITEVARRLGIDHASIAAIGDDVNDIEMIRQAGLGIAMGNAAERVKAVARWQAPRNDEAGLATAVQAILDGEQDLLQRKAG